MLSDIPIRYKEIELIKKSSTGNVYKAYDSITSKNVIIKNITNKYIEENILNFKKNMLKLSCDQIVKINDIIQTTKSNYIIEQFVAGNSLNKYIKNNKLSLNDFLLIAQDISKACNYLKQNNLVHMDIKPSNIIYNENVKKAVLIDLDYVYFSIAKSKYKYIGTLYYSAPEQIINNIVSSNSDIYSLGIVLYLLIEGVFPFSYNKEGIISKVNNRINLSFNNLNESPLKEKIIILIKKMVENQPGERISVKDLLECLKNLYLEAESLNILNTPLRKNQAITVADYNKGNDLEVEEFIDITETVFDKSVFLNTETINIKQDNSMENDLILYNINKDRDRFVNRDEINNTAPSYQKQLINEYDSIIIQAKISFGLWVSAFVLSYGIIITAIVLICLGRYTDAIITVVLEALIYAIQRLFSIKEDHYRDLIKNIIKHLERGDYWEYAFKKMDDYMDDSTIKNNKISEIIDSIRKQAEIN